MSGAQVSDGIAIIGMACRFPGANSPSDFWRNLCEGVESITFFSDADLLAAGVAPALLHQPHYVKAAPILQDVDKFDASFFAYAPREAALMDPQQRLFLEVAWETFEDAGYYPETYDGVVGVFAGGGGVVTSYLVAHQGHPALPGQTAGLQHIGNDKDFLCTRVSYKLNLTGPSIAVQTACSTSIVAVHLACQSLLSGECDMVLAGASTVRIPHLSGYLVEKGNVHSLDGHCRAFDADGKGTIFGSGVAAILLKPVQAAIADNDHIYALIKSTAVNNDGARKVSYTAPSAVSQARAMVEAFTLGDIAPDTVSYVECHATGTTVGDPLEIQALSRAFQTQTSRKQFCAVGSVKSNIGHPEQTAGLAGLIKTALALYHKRIPPTLHLVTPNPKIDFANSPFFVNTELQDWPAGPGPRRAAVNSLGIGGTNAFAILEEAPPMPPRQAVRERPVHLFTLSAKQEAALVARAAQMRDFLDANADMSLADICYTANVSRSAFAHRIAVTAATVVDLRHQLAAFADGQAPADVASSQATAPPIAFLFSGQGSQYPGMAVELYHTQPTFREALERCDALLRPHLELPLLDVLLASDERALLVHETAYTQPALFALAYALAQLWQAWGVRPGAVMGHSIGELVAACVAGVMDLDTALPLVAQRGQLMQRLPKSGAMAVVLAPAAVVQDVLAPDADRVTIAAVNSTQQTVISGVREAVAGMLEAFQARHIPVKMLNVSHAFHSPMMDAMLNAFEAAAQSVPYKAPQITWISNLTGAPLEQAPVPRYWRDHVRHPVRFAAGLKTLHELGYTFFLEIGPGTALTSMARQTLSAATGLASLQPQPGSWQTMLESLRRLYLAGCSINWPEVDAGLPRCRVSLPTYPFQRRRYWLETGATAAAEVPRHTVPTAHPLLGTRLRSGLKALQFESLYGGAQLPYMQEHRIYGMVVLPTTVGIEAALAAAQAYFGGSDLSLEHLLYHEALVFEADATRLVQVILTPHGPDKAGFQLLSTSPDGQAGADDWRTHMSGTVSRTQNLASASAVSPFSVSAAQARCMRRMSPEHYYAAMRDLGLDYGPAFQGIQQVWQGEGEALSYVLLPPQVAPHPYAIHPAFLDACLHLYPALMQAVDEAVLGAGPPAQTYLPLGVERFRLFRTQPTAAWVHAVLRQAVDQQETRVLDIRLYDDAGYIVAALEGLSIKPLSPEALSPVAEAPWMDWLYHMTWEVCPLVRPPEAGVHEGPASWLIFADRGGVGTALAACLQAQGQQCHLVFPDAVFAQTASQRWSMDPTRREDFNRLLHDLTAAEPYPLRGVVYLWGGDSPPMHGMTLAQLEMAEVMGHGGALFLLQALAASRQGGEIAARVWLVTRQAQHAGPETTPVEAAQAPLWGFGRTVQLEYPLLWGGLIDLPPASSTSARQDAQALVAELLHSDGEDQIALRPGQRFVARLTSLPRVPAHQETRPYRSDATYLVTGGLGMLGGKIARWLVDTQGVRTLVLTGRREPQGAASAAVETLRARGAQVHVLQADVSVEADVQRILTTIRQELPPLKGIFHAAGVLDDGILGQLDWPQFARVTAPKIKGSWLLHHYTQDMDLDVFVLHASVLSLTGSAGQANYTAANAFLDALVDHRRALGLPALAINWGPWDEGGMATVSGARGVAMWQARGLRFIPPEAGMRVFDYLMQQQVTHAAVALIDWSVYVEQFVQLPPVYRMVAPQTETLPGPPRGVGTQDIRGRLRAAPAREQRNLLVDFIRAQVMVELGFEETIDSGQPLNELGLDSLMAVNLVNRLEAALDVAVPLVILIQGPSVEQLVDALFPATPGSVATPSDASVATAPIAPPARHPTSQTAGNGWLVFPKPNPSANLRLFCFPFAGGGAATYRPWAESLRTTIELVAIEPPGRASRIQEPPVYTIAAFLDALVPAMVPFLDKPCAFFGHCLGGLNLFETVRMLIQQHTPDIAHIFISGSRPPHRVTRQGAFEENLFTNILDHDKFDPFFPMHEQPDDVFAAIIRHFNIGATDDFLANPDLRQLLLPAVRADFAMASRYAFTSEPPWAVPITCFMGLDDPYVTHADAVAWAQYTKVAFRLHMRESAHFMVVDDKAFILATINRELSP